MSVVVTTCQESIQPSPAHFNVGCGISLLGLLATLCIHSARTRHMRTQTAFSAKRLLYRAITSLAPAICVINFLAVTSPPSHKFAGLVQHIVVAGSMAAFMELLLLLCYRTSLAPDGGGEADVPGIANVLQLWETSFSTCTLCGGVEPSAYINGVLSVMTRQADIDFWASPPIGCWFALCPGWPCGQRQRPTPRLIALLRHAVLLYAVGAVFGPMLELWVEGVPALAAHHAAVGRAVSLLETIVTLTALYALFITYRLSKGPLHAYHTTLKFAAVKILVFATPLQRHLLTNVLGASSGVWWLHVLTVAECPLLSALLWRAFPPSELPSAAGRTVAERDSDDEATRLVASATP